MNCKYIRTYATIEECRNNYPASLAGDDEIRHSIILEGDKTARYGRHLTSHPNEAKYPPYPR